MAKPRSEATQEVEDCNQGATVDGEKPFPVSQTVAEESALGSEERSAACGIQRPLSTRTIALEQTAGDNATSGKTLPPTPPYTPRSLEAERKTDESTLLRDEANRKEPGVGRGISPVQEEPVFQESEEEIVGDGMIKVVGEETIFTSAKHKFRLRVQKDSVASQDQAAGPVTVSILDEKIEFEGIPLQGMLLVKCLPSGYRFNSPLLFDFPVGGGDISNPIIDEYGCVRYEVLVKEHEGGKWSRDPESRAAPLEVVRENYQIYVRASVRHFSWFSLWQKMETKPQNFEQESVPIRQRRRRQSLVQNDTKGVHIQVYVMRMSQWSACLESAGASIGAQGVAVTGEVAGNIAATSTNVALAPQLCTIQPGYSQWFEIPRCGIGIFSSRKAAVCIVTQVNDEHGPKTMRVEGIVQLRSKMRLTVKFPVENGRVLGTPAASGLGGVLLQVMRIINNTANATNALTRTPSDTSHTSRPALPDEFRRSCAEADRDGYFSASSSET